MPEVHRVATPTVRPVGHQPFRRNRDSRPASALAQAKTADEVVLQISPGEERQGPELDPRKTLLQRRLGGDEQDRPDDESAVRGAREPPHALAASVLGMKKINRFATTMVPARK